MALSEDPVLRARQLANLKPGINAGENWRGGIKPGYTFAVHYQLHCVVCGGMFDAKKRDQRFCSVACRAEAKLIRDILAGKKRDYRSLAQRFAVEARTGSAFHRILQNAGLWQAPVEVGPFRYATGRLRRSSD
ncbi:MAG: hypothetical protein J2O48_02505 [Solirubrobacterales bacterium]|nr:hypothetical protein [Solirubrobacterales bacterium]